ncbi:MAG: RluA family pseudouridine synthase [Treponema sp.]|jgi:23S rRNA pseudouridine955/2504/2580 synthase|nr:RluA family pseudouridine synthase [Treponema sp.]
MVEIKAAQDDENRRLDRILRKFSPDTPLSHIYRLLRKGNIRINGKKAGAEDVCLRVMAGDVIAVPDEFFAARDSSARNRTGAASREAPSIPPDARFRVVFENDDLLVINKSAGVVVHGGAFPQKQKNLAEMVESYLGDTIPRSLSFKPGPLHRLDQPTSGLVMFSKSLAGARRFTALIRERKIVKRYLALVDGLVERAELWRDDLVRDSEERTTFAMKCAISGARDSRYAETYVEPVASNSVYSLVFAEIHTGRTHQIRSQAALHGHPLAGDKKYGGSFLKTGLLLHAYSLEFPSETGLPVLNAPLPHAFQQVIKNEFPSFHHVLAPPPRLGLANAGHRSAGAKN